MRNPVVLFFVVLALGVWGWLAWPGYLRPEGTIPGGAAVLNALYRAVQLFTLNFDINQYDAPIPWQLHIARFAAPLLSVWAIVRLFSNALMPLPNALWARLWGRDEYVVVGYGEAGRALTRAIVDLSRHEKADNFIARRRNKPRIVAVGRDVEDGDIADAARAGIELYRRDVRLGTRLSDSGKGFGAAKRIIVAQDSDEETLEIGRLLIARHDLDPASTWLHIRDEDLLDRLRDADETEAVALRGNARVFGLTEAAVEQMIAEATPVLAAQAMGHTRLHAVIVGDGPQIRAVVEGLALYTTFPAPGLARPRITLVAPDAKNVLRVLLARHPDLVHWVKFTAMDADLDAVTWLDGSALVRSIECLDPPSMWLFAIASEGVGLPHALALRRAMELGRASQAPVHVFSRYADDLEQANRADGVSLGKGLFFAGNLQRAAHFSVALNPRLEQVARRFHAQWAGPRDPDYDSLGETMRNSNWRAALHAIQKLASLGFENVDARRPAFGLVEADIAWLQDAIDNAPEKLEGLSRAEHVRWCVDRVLDGWKPGPHSSNGARIRHQLVHSRHSFDMLSDHEQAKDADQVRELVDHFRATVWRNRLIQADMPRRIACERASALRWKDDGRARFDEAIPDLDALMDRAEGMVRWRLLVPPLASRDADVRAQARASLADLAEEIAGRGYGERLIVRFERPFWEDWEWMAEVDRRGMRQVEAVTLGPLTVGFAGHRDLARLDASKAELEAALDRTFADLVSRGRNLRLVTGMSDGGDALAVRHWTKAGLGDVLALYPDQAHLDAARAGGLHDLSTCHAITGHADGPDHAEQARTMLESAHVLIALYDGAGNKGAGGTGDTIALARAMGREVILPLGENAAD